MTQAWDYNVPSVPVSASIPQESEPSVQETADMIQKAFGKIMDKALEHTTLTDQVKQLADRVNSLEQEVASLRQQLHDAQEENRGLAQNIDQLNAVISQKETSIHDLIAERDIVLQERNDARQDRDTARRESADWSEKYSVATQQLDDARAHNTRLQAQLEELQAKVEGFRNAFRGLAA